MTPAIVAVRFCAAALAAAAASRDLTFRFVAEGVQAVLPFVDPAAILTAGLRDLRRMLEVYYPALVDFDFGGEGGAFKKQLDGIREFALFCSL